MNRQITILVRAELKEIFAQRRVYHFLPLLVIGSFLMAWIFSVGSPFAPIIVLVVTGLEPQFNNIIFRTPNELQALGILSCSWRNVIVAKNVASLIHFGLFLILVSMSLLYFSPEAITGAHAEEAALYIVTVAFPLLHTGNTQSLRRPRRYSGLRLEDLVQAVWMCVNLALLSVPFYVFSNLPLPWISCTAYGVLTGILWYKISVRSSSVYLAEHFSDLCLTD